MTEFKIGLKNVINVFDKILCFLGVIFYLTFCVCVLVQVISRNFLPTAPSWTEEGARYAFTYMVAFGCAVAVHRDEFVNVEFLHDALAHKHGIVNKIISFIIKILLCIFSGYLLVKSIIPFAFIKFPMYSTALTIPMQYVYFSTFILFLLLTIAYFLEIIYSVLAWNDEEEDHSELAQAEVIGEKLAREHLMDSKHNARSQNVPECGSVVDSGNAAELQKAAASESGKAVSVTEREG